MDSAKTTANALGPRDKRDESEVTRPTLSLNQGESQRTVSAALSNRSQSVKVVAMAPRPS